MDWIRLSVEDLESALNKNQLDLLKAESAKNSNRDYVTEILNSTVALVRANIAASGANYLDVDHARIPVELRDCVLRLAIESLQARFPSLEMSKIQTKQADFAHETLKSVANGTLPVSRPLMGVRTANPKKGIYGKRGSTNIATRKTMGGL